MSAQIGDSYILDGQKLSVVAMSDDMNFKPQDFGLCPVGCISACWRGYWCIYEIKENTLYLKDLYINDKNLIHPKLNGKKLSKKKYMEHRCYGNVYLPINFSGKIFVGNNFLDEYYIHMGIQRFWAYKKLSELTFENGKLISIISLDNIAEKMRKIINENSLAIKEMIIEREKFLKKNFTKEEQVYVKWL